MLLAETVINFSLLAPALVSHLDKAVYRMINACNLQQNCFVLFH